MLYYIDEYISENMHYWCVSIVYLLGSKPSYLLLLVNPAWERKFEEEVGSIRQYHLFAVG